jgi:hypothetical protein
MANWTFDPSQYEERRFELIPVGDYRARVKDVTEKTFRSGNAGYEITMEINGYNSQVWFYLVLDKNDPKKTTQRIGDFFNSFGIADHSMGSGKQWIGKVGAVRVVHEEYNGNTQAKVAYVLNRKNQDKLPPAKFNTEATANTASNFATVDVSDDALPFSV